MKMIYLTFERFHKVCGAIMSLFTYLGMGEADLKHKGALFTAREIANQPALWLKTYDFVYRDKNNIQNFCNTCFHQDQLEIILTGAGTSAFIGDVLEGPFQQRTGIKTRAVATTDLVTHAEQYLHRDKPILLISFARSGNSPESVAAVELANIICNNIYHLIITCNPDGALAQKRQGSNSYVFLLPAEAHDQSLAMTGSFTSMLLTGLLLSLIDKIDDQEKVVKQLCQSANMILADKLTAIKEIAELPFSRAVFLGSGPLQGVARESHLKLQELSDGNIICKHDSFLGFRHGPKAVINKETLLVFLFSNDRYVSNYEYDLVKDINNGERGLARVGIGEGISEDLDLTLTIPLSVNGPALPEEFLAVVNVLPAQILGFFKSLALGLAPDTPSSSGTITRVVQGVNIYSYTKIADMVV
jgi:tagatose-6-phosphate ketose/aldose isomerase